MVGGWESRQLAKLRLRPPISSQSSCFQPAVSCLSRARRFQWEGSISGCRCRPRLFIMALQSRWAATRGAIVKRALFGVVAIATFVAAPAFAADMAVKAPPALVPAYSWSGWYSGGNVGGGWTRGNVTYSPNDPASVDFFGFGNDALGDSFKSSSAVGGLQMGYNYQFNRNWLVGFETDFDWTGMKGSSVTQYFGGLEFSSAQQRIDSFGTVRGRLGYLPTENLLAYVTGGLAYGRVERTASYAAANGGSISIVNGSFSLNCASPPTGTCFAGSSNNTAIGWTFGGGLEYALGQMWSVKAEYMHLSLNSRSLTEVAPAPNAGSTPSTLNANYSQTNIDTVRVGLNYHFH
jgi:outer membrane immunogenic protein